MKTLLTLLFGALVLCAWGPWVDGTFIEQRLRLDSEREAPLTDSTEPCNFKRVISSYRTAFGHTVKAEYACLNPDPMQRNMFVSSFGKVFVLSKLKPLENTTSQPEY